MKQRGTNRIGVIGGGLGGLAAACTLAARGYEVVLFERSAWLGGKAAVLCEQGYLFDMGPTILTLPEVLARIFAEAGRSLDAELDLIPLDPQWRCFFADGSALDLHADRVAMQHALAEFAPGTTAPQDYERFLQHAARLHEISNRFFFWRSLGGIRDMFAARSLLEGSMLKVLSDLRPGRSVSETIRSHVSDTRLAQMLDHFTQYVGSAPDQSPAVLCGIAHMQTRGGGVVSARWNGSRSCCFGRSGLRPRGRASHPHERPPHYDSHRNCHRRRDG